MVEHPEFAGSQEAPESGSRPRGESPSAGSAAAGATVPGMAGAILARLEILGLLDDLGMAQEVLDVFVHDAGQSLEELGRAIRAGDGNACERLAHRVKGSSLNLGIEELGALARALEEKGRSGDLTGAEDLYAAMRREHEALSSIAPGLLHKAA